MKKRVFGFALVLISVIVMGWTYGSVEANAASYVKSSEVKEVVRLVNVQRTKRGLKKLKLVSNVSKATDVRAKEISKLFSHIRPNGKRCFTVLDSKKISYRFAGENIAMGQKTAKEVVKDWMNSAPHKKNILSKNYTKIGVSGYIKNGMIHWVQVFVG